MEILSFAEADTPQELRRQVIDLQHEAWPPEPGSVSSEGDLTHDPALLPQSMLLLDEGVAVAALDILTKTVAHGGRSFCVGGLSTVVTRELQRGRGYGQVLVVAAHQAMAASVLDLGLFTCDRPLQGFYERAGWHVIPGAVIVGGTVAAPFPSDQAGFDKVTMGDFFSDKGRTHRGSFDNSRIGLYPGDIDRLW